MLIRKRDYEKLSILFAVIMSIVVVIAAGVILSHRVQANEEQEALDELNKVNTVQTETETETEYAQPVTETKKNVNLIQADTKQLSIPQDARNPIMWSSMNTLVCTVDNNGFVRAVGAGSTFVQCTYTDVSTKTRVSKPKTVDGQTFVVKTITTVYTNVTRKWPVYVEPLKLNTSNVRLLSRRVGTVLKINSSNARKNAYWSSSNRSVARVNQNGKVLPYNPGSCVVSATWNGITLTCNVRVVEVTEKSILEMRSPKLSRNRNKVVLAGSGILDHWAKTKAAFSPTTVINNGISNSTFANWLSWYKKLIVDYRPKAVVLCLGTEEIGPGKSQLSGKDCATNMKKLIEKIHGNKHTRKTKIFVVTIPQNPERENKWDEIKDFNKIMKAYCSQKSYLTYINLNGALMDDDVPVPAYFKPTHTYLSTAGYKVFKDILVKKVRKAIR